MKKEAIRVIIGVILYIGTIVLHKFDIINEPIYYIVANVIMATAGWEMGKLVNRKREENEEE